MWVPQPCIPRCHLLPPLDDLAPRSRHARHRRVVGTRCAFEGRPSAATRPLRSDGASTSLSWRTALLANETVTFRGAEFRCTSTGWSFDYVHQERRPKQVADRHRRHGVADDESWRGEIGDGRRFLNYLVSPSYNEGCARGPHRRCPHGWVAPSTTSTGPNSSWCSMDDDRGRRARRPPACSSRSTSGSKPHIMKAVGGARGAASMRSAKCSRGRRRTRTSSPHRSWSPDDIVQLITASGTPGGLAGPKVGRIRRHRVHLPGALPVGRRRRPRMIDAFTDWHPDPRRPDPTPPDPAPEGAPVDYEE